jgi:hypothetical protein
MMEAVSFCLHGELYVLVVIIVQAVSKVPQPVRTMGLDDKSAIHAKESAQGLRVD